MLKKYNLFIRDTNISHCSFIIYSEFNVLLNNFKNEDAIIPIIFENYVGFVGFIKLLEIDGYKTIENKKILSFILNSKQVIEITNSNNETIKLEISINNKLYNFLWKHHLIVYVKHIYEHYDWWFCNVLHMLNFFDSLTNLILGSDKFNGNKILKIIDTLRIYKDKYDPIFLKEYIETSKDFSFIFSHKFNDKVDSFIKNIMDNQKLVENIKDKLKIDLMKKNWFFDYILALKM